MYAYAFAFEESHVSGFPFNDYSSYTTEIKASIVFFLKKRLFIYSFLTDILLYDHLRPLWQDNNGQKYFIFDHKSLFKAQFSSIMSNLRYMI